MPLAGWKMSAIMTFPSGRPDAREHISQLGHSRRFGWLPVTSGPPRTTDTNRPAPVGPVRAKLTLRAWLKKTKEPPSLEAAFTPAVLVSLEKICLYEFAALRSRPAFIRASIRSLPGGNCCALSSASVASASRFGSGKMVGGLLLTSCLQNLMENRFTHRERKSSIAGSENEQGLAAPATSRTP